MQVFGWTVAGIAGAVLLAFTAGRLARRVRLPVAVVFLLAAAVASDLWPSLGARLGPRDVEWLASGALLVILFEGGVSLGWRAVRSQIRVVSMLGLGGTLAAAGVVTLATHSILGLAWSSAAVLGVALSPTDPAVVFSVLGETRLDRRLGVILEAESGANDPVAIALMVGVLAGIADPGGRWAWVVISSLLRELLIGLLIGIAGGFAARRGLRFLTAPNDVLQPIVALAGAALVFGVAAGLHGSGFLAVFVAGLMVGDGAPGLVGEVRRFQAELASLAEVVVFVALGLTVHLSAIDPRELGEGLAISAILLVLARPPAVIALLAAVRVPAVDRVFVAWAGMRGAVPILLAAVAAAAGAPDSGQIYRLVFVVVVTSVLIQGLTLEPLRRRCERAGA